MNNERTQGIIIGKVTAVKDKENLGRIQVTYPWLNGPVQRMVPVASPMAGTERGMFFMPEVDDEVLLAFNHGMFDHPYVIGFLWNHQQKAPSPDERQRMIKSKNGHTIRFVDSTPFAGNKGALIISDAHDNTIMMTNSHITIKTRGELHIEAASMTINGRLVRSAGPPI
jgi:uncharacterized protein involved in type VI secretion and phage assembly